MAVIQVFVLNRPDIMEVFGVHEDLVAGCEVDLVFVDGDTPQAPRATTPFPAYRAVVIVYGLLDRPSLEVDQVHPSVALTLVGGTHYGARDNVRESFHTVLCSVFFTATYFTHLVRTRWVFLPARTWEVSGGDRLRRSVSVRALPPYIIYPTCCLKERQSTTHHRPLGCHRRRIVDRVVFEKRWSSAALTAHCQS